MNRKATRAVLAILLILLLGTVACVRTLNPDTTTDEKGLATDAAAETKDAAVQMTLEALLGTATNEVESPTDPSPTEESTLEASTATPEATLEPTLDETNETTTPAVSETPDGTETASPTATEELADGEICYQSRFVYDETYPDGTRVDPSEEIEKTWRLQNVGECDWVNGKYQLVFVSGDQMGGANPTLLEFTVLAGAYSNFSITLTAPDVPGDYYSYWRLESTDGDPLGWGDDSEGTMYLQIQVRGDTPTPTP